MHNGNSHTNSSDYIFVNKNKIADYEHYCTGRMAIKKHIPKFSESEISAAKVKVAIKKRLKRKNHAKGIDNYIDEL